MSSLASRNYIKAEWSEHDDNCSKSCTRSGIAVLLLCALALSLLPSLNKMESLNALLGYISRRITLKEEFIRLHSDPVWKRLKAADPSAETWELGKLLTYTEDWTAKKSTPKLVPPAQQSSEGSTKTPPETTIPSIMSGGRASQESPPTEVTETTIKHAPAAPTALAIRDLRGLRQ